jgi:hypothetical protein
VHRHMDKVKDKLHSGRKRERIHIFCSAFSPPSIVQVSVRRQHDDGSHDASVFLSKKPFTLSL